MVGATIWKTNVYTAILSIAYVGMIELATKFQIVIPNNQLEKVLKVCRQNLVSTKVVYAI